MGLRLALFNDITNRKLVRGRLEPASFILPPVSDQDNISIELQGLELNPGGGPQAPFSIVDPESISPTVAIGSQDLSTIYAAQTVWTADADRQILTGKLNLNTVAMATALGSLTQLECVFAVFLTDTNGQDMTFQGPITVKKSLVRSGTAATVPVGTYYTTDQVNALFVKKLGLAGETITLIDSTGAYGRVLGVNTDGSGMDDSYHI